MNDELVVWLGSEPVAVIRRDGRGYRDRLSLRYLESAFRRFRVNAPVLSLSLPLREQPFPNALTRNFFDNLLPEGHARTAIARRFRLDPGDTFGFLEALGRDCAGAIVVQSPDTAPPPESARPTDAPPVSQAHLARLIADLPSSPLGVDESVRISLAGVQAKLTLVRVGNDKWGLPEGGTPPTHILKPAIDEQRFPRSAGNELLCMRTAHHLGVPVAAVDWVEVTGADVLVVERFDRVRGDGTVHRVHQEDACQALGVPVGRKYEHDGGPRLRQIARLLTDYGRPEDLRSLLRLTTFNVAVGNADAHGKNIAFLHDEEGRIRLAPGYDIMSTMRYPKLDLEMAMYVGSARRIDRVKNEHLLDEAVSWGVRKDEALAIIEELFAHLPSALDAAHDELGVHADGALRDVVLRQTARVVPAPRHSAAPFRLEELVTGTVGPAVPVPSGAVRHQSAGPVRALSNRVWVHPYCRDDGTPVRGHWRELG